MSTSRSWFWLLPGWNSRLASMKRTSCRSSFAPPGSRERSKSRIAAGGAPPGRRRARKPNERVEQVLLDELLTDPALRPAAEKHPVRRDHAYPSLTRERRLYHVADERVVALAFRRDSAPEPPVLVVRRVLGAPLVERERRGCARPRAPLPPVLFP